MVNIIINDNNGENNTVIDTELLELFESLKVENKDLKQTVIDLKKQVTELQAGLSILTEYVTTDLTSIIKESTTNTVQSNNENKTKETVTINTSKSKKRTKKTKRGRKSRAKNDDLYEPNKNVRTEWKELKLEDDGRIINHGKRVFKLPINLNQLLYIYERINKDITFGEAKKLMKTFNILPGTFGKLVYNLRETRNFDPVFTKYNNNLHKAHFAIDRGYLMMNKVDTNISVKLAREWIQILANTPNRQEKILELQESYKDISADMIRIVCDSYNNPKLNKLLKSNKNDKVFVENNPSKRRNLIMNGGLL